METRIINTLLALTLCISGLSAQTLTNVEAVEYDASQNRFFISNGSSIIQEDSDANLAFFGTGNATAGMEVMNGVLYVNAGSSVVGYDLVTEQEVTRILIPGAGFLNGMTNDGSGIIYNTDFSNGRINKIDFTDLNNPELEVIVTNTGCTVNGIHYDGDKNRLIFVCFNGNGDIKAVDLATNAVSTIIGTPYGPIDGIVTDNQGNYYISEWSNDRIVKYDNNFENAEVITTPFLSGPADISYAKEIEVLAIPHSGNQVTYVSFGSTSLNDIDILNDISVYPNPITDQSIISFELEQASEVNMVLFTIDGKHVKTLLSGNKIAGQHQVSMIDHQLDPGMYLVIIKIDGEITTRKVVVE